MLAGWPVPRSLFAQSVPVRDGARAGYRAEDVRFMQGMIAHHAQAVTMAVLVLSRSHRQDLRLLAQRIEVSQQDEIAMMRRWLTDRQEQVPRHEDHDGHQQPSEAPMRMPGMLTPEQMTRLTQATDTAFDRLFLEGMIQHHEGALTMVRELFAIAGAGQEPQLFAFASDVDADQRAEIRRMRALLAALPAGPT
jgi:uncharacterized protein (DUF305 family)